MEIFSKVNVAVKHAPPYEMGVDVFEGGGRGGACGLRCFMFGGGDGIGCGDAGTGRGGKARCVILFFCFFVSFVFASEIVAASFVGVG